MDSGETKIGEIGFFWVTNREADVFFQQHLTPELIKSLPRDANILIIGSGLEQRLAKRINQFRKDVTVIPLDPTLALTTTATFKDKSGTEIRFATSHQRSPEGRLKAVSYEAYPKGGKRPLYSDSLASQKTVDKERRAASGPNSLAALAPALPFAPATIDLALDFWGPGLYLAWQPLADYLARLTTILKDGGRAIIFPTDFYGDSLLDWPSRRRNGKARYRKILRGLKGINFQFYRAEDSASQLRIGVVIRKGQ